VTVGRRPRRCALTPASGSAEQWLGLREERRGTLTGLLGLEALRHELQDVPPLLAASSRHAQHSLDKPAAPLARCPAARLPPQDGVPQRPLRRVVRRLDPLHPQEGPQVLRAPASSGTSPRSSRWRTTHRGSGPAGRPTGSAGHSPGTFPRPSRRPDTCATSGTAGGGPEQLRPNRRPIVAAVNHRLEIPAEVRPAILMLHDPIIAGEPVTDDDFSAVGPED
jgi:hypothetical protein